jgi:hypothetical protein
MVEILLDFSSSPPWISPAALNRPDMVRKVDDIVKDFDFLKRLSFCMYGGGEEAAPSSPTDTDPYKRLSESLSESCSSFTDTETIRLAEQYRRRLLAVVEESHRGEEAAPSSFTGAETNLAKEMGRGGRKWGRELLRVEW